MVPKATREKRIDLVGEGKRNEICLSFRIKNFDLIELPEEEHGEFFSADCYIVLYAYSSISSENYVIYYWIVSASDLYVRVEGRFFLVFVLAFLEQRRRKEKEDSFLSSVRGLKNTIIQIMKNTIIQLKIQKYNTVGSGLDFELSVKLFPFYFSIIRVNTTDVNVLRECAIA